MHAPPQASTNPRSSSQLIVALILAAIFLIRLWPWMSADLWFDEVLMIDDYVGMDSVVDVFTTYRAANNHLLFTVIERAWMILIDPLWSSWIIRIPSAIFSAAVIVIAVMHWRKWLGDRGAVLAGMIFAASLVFASFGYQARGYAMSMLLGTIATSGLMELISGSRKRGLILYLPCAVILPLILPTNVLLIAGHVITLLLIRPLAWGSILLILAATVLGSSFYLLILNQFMNVLENQEGWSSGLSVAGALGVGLLAHLGILFPFAVAQSSQQISDDARLALKLIIGPVVLISLFLALQNPSPFPRTFLVFLPTVTCAVVLAAIGSLPWKHAHPIVIGILILIQGAAWQFATDQSTRIALARAEEPQDLIRQYYRSRSDVSDLTTQIRQRGLGAQIILITDFHDFPTTRWEWRIQRLDPNRIVCIWPNPPNAIPTDGLLAVQAVSEADAKRLLTELGITPPPRLQILLHSSPLSIWTN